MRAFVFALLLATSLCAVSAQSKYPPFSVYHCTDGNIDANITFNIGSSYNMMLRSSSSAKPSTYGCRPDGDNNCKCSNSHGDELDGELTWVYNATTLSATISNLGGTEVLDCKGARLDYCAPPGTPGGFGNACMHSVGAECHAHRGNVPVKP